MPAPKRRVHRDDHILSRLASEDVRQHDRHGINSPVRERSAPITVQADAVGLGTPQFDRAIVGRRQVACVSPDSHVKQVVIVAPDPSAPQHGQAAE
ncbi:hypothetical protein ASF51_14870 [Agreia sp. Leaf283]|nr:hypothetical protein ASF51_14870 [Agreia sp. Leaf283]